MKNIISHSNITSSVTNKLYETYILNPVRMQTETKPALHALFTPDMPDIVAKIESHEKFYKNRKTRYDIEPVVLFKEFSDKGYVVCTILLDNASKYDRDMWDRAIARISSRCGDKTTFRLAKDSDVLSEADWEYAIAVLNKYGRVKDTLELYPNIQNAKSACENCVHKEVCKYLFINKPQPDCKYFLKEQ